MRPRGCQGVGEAAEPLRQHGEDHSGAARCGSATRGPLPGPLTLTETAAPSRSVDRPPNGVAAEGSDREAAEIRRPPTWWSLIGSLELVGAMASARAESPADARSFL